MDQQPFWRCANTSIMVHSVTLSERIGATASGVLWGVARSAMRVIATGAVSGLDVSAVQGRLLTTMLFGVQAWDPLRLHSFTSVLALTSAVSTIGPAWHATRIDPAVTLRQE